MDGFSFNEFYQRNRRVVIWVILFLLLWLLRDFFGLVFLTFVLAIIAAPLAEYGERRLKLPHWLSLSLVYLMFLFVLASFVRFVVPSVTSEVNRMIGNLPETETRLIEVKNRLLDSYPTLRQPLNGYLRSALTDIGLPKGDIPLALFTFNVGVELGQLAFIGVVFGVMTLAKRIRLASVVDHRALPAATYTIGILAAFWFFERLAGF